MGHEQIDLALGQAGIGHDDPGIHAAGGKHQYAQRHAVLADYEQAVTGPDAQRLELRLRGHRRVVQLPVAECHVRIAHRGGVGVIGNPGLHQLVEARRRGSGIWGHGVSCGRAACMAPALSGGCMSMATLQNDDHHRGV